jgi:hypothetical protein
MTIELYRPAHSPAADDLETALRKLVVAHKVIVVNAAHTPLPAIHDEGQVITGPAALARYLQELEKIVADWRKYQGDACYINDDGEVC